MFLSNFLFFFAGKKKLLWKDEFLFFWRIFIQLSFFFAGMKKKVGWTDFGGLVGTAAPGSDYSQLLGERRSLVR